MKPFTKIAAVIFAIMAIVHIYRLIAHFEVIVAGRSLPLWINVVAFMITAALSAGLWKESKR